jgi:outer membrane autotransporter protein
MNRTHRIIWSASRNAFIVTSEGAKAKGKLSSTRKAIVVAVLSALGSLAAMPALANTSCPGGGLPISIGGAETSTCNLNTGDSLTVTNSGSINVSTHDGVVVVSSTVDSLTNNGSIFGGGIAGITLGSSTVGSITNNTGGSISGGSYGIYVGGNNSTVGSITNSGSISGSTYVGIFLNSGSTISGSITNNRGGSISGGSTGINLGNGSTIYGGISNNGTISGGRSAGIALYYSTVTGSITNSGLITANGAFNNSSRGAGILLSSSSSVGGIINNTGGTISGVLTGIALKNSSSVTGSITNSGTISGGSYAIYASANSTLANLDLTGNNTAHLIGDVLAQNTDVTVKAGATFGNTNAFEVKSFTVESGATFNMGAGPNTSGMMDGITVSNGFTNAGTVAIADATTATITGDYTQSGKLSIGASSSSSYGKLLVTGAVTLSSGASFDVNVANINTLAKGDTLSGVLSSSTSLTNNAGTLTVTDNSALFNFTAAVNGNGNAVDLTTVAGTSVLGSVTSTGFNAGAGAAAVLDGFVNGGATGTGMDNVVTALGQLSSAQAVSDAVAQTLPLFTAGMNQVALNALHGTNLVIQARQDSNRGQSSGDAFLGDRQFWLKPVGSWASQGNHNGVAGYDASTYGLVGGTDGEINDSSRIGVAFSYMHSNVDGISTSSGNNAAIDAYQGIVYGSHNLALPDTHIDWQADLGTNKNKGYRAISFMNSVAQSDYDSLTAHAGVGIGRSYTLNDKTTITPGLHADYTWLRSDGYTEAGAGPLNLNVNSQSTDELIVLAEGRLSHAVTDKATLSANLGVGYNVLNNGSSVTASYVGGGAAFSTPGLDVSPWLARGGLGLAFNISESTEITARYDVEYRQDYVNQTASVKAKWAF